MKQPIPTIVMTDIMEIKPYLRNPRKNSKTIDTLCEMIPRVGFNVPIVIDKKGVIVKGHSRYAAALRLGMTSIPCLISQNSDEMNKLDRIADNRIAEFSKWDNSLLELELDSLTVPFEALDFDFTHAMEEDLNFVAEGPEVSEKAIKDAEDKLSDRQNSKFAQVVCEKCGHMMFVREGDLRYEG